MMKARIQTRQRTEIHAVFFGIFLITALVGSLITAYCCSGPIIIGTEMNTNGMVEYLCLGNGCENLTAMHWNDK